jgi:hypothetical protein
LRQAGLTNKGGFVPVDIQSNRLLAASGGGGGGGGGGASGGGAGAGASPPIALRPSPFALRPSPFLTHTNGSASTADSALTGVRAPLAPF